MFMKSLAMKRHHRGQLSFPADHLLKRYLSELQQITLRQHVCDMVRADLLRLGKGATERFVALVRHSSSDNWHTLARMLHELSLPGALEALQSVALGTDSLAVASRAVLEAAGLPTSGPAQQAIELLKAGRPSLALSAEVARALLQVLRNRPRESAEPWVSLLQNHADADVARQAAAQAQRCCSTFQTVPTTPEAELLPIHECLVSNALWEQGIGHVLVSRKLHDDRLRVTQFLVDIWCLGVKDTVVRVAGEGVYRNNLVPRIHGGMHRVSAAYAAKLIQDSVAYAAGLGLQPHPDYHSANAALEGIDVNECQEVFRFGKDGKPCFVTGPKMTAGQARQIMQQLTNAVGRDGFDFMGEAWQLQAAL
ncbi:MAG: hypothetical protein ACYCW6_15590 [Candidatus Xenobia bacterium]